ncbi:MAG: rhodanese-like domain-containing protein [Chloroflexota bacterium]|nr:rhodanese-like domain-containing protein [Chloroflexota bacterium]
MERGAKLAPMRERKPGVEEIVTSQEPFQRIDVHEAHRRQADGATLIDCREADEYAEGHAAGAPLIPHMSVFQRAGEVETIAGGKDQPVMFICKSGGRSAVASEFAAAAGFSDLYNVEGGTDAWIEAGLPIER